MKTFLLTVLALLTIALNVVCGSVAIPLGELADSRWSYILWQVRLPQALTAVLTGASLSACGLLLQTYFRNPLAGPSILGITSGAHLAVALLTLGAATLGLSTATELTGMRSLAALAGAGTVIWALLVIGRHVRQQTTLLIVGIMISYLASSMITLLSYQATAHGVQQLLVWGMGDFGSVGSQHIVLYSLLNIIGLSGAFLLIKPMNAWMLGEKYAMNSGLNLARTRWMLLAVTGLLSAVTTAWCGPIAFVGLTMSHVSRWIFHTDDHRVLLPATMSLGALTCGLCLWLSTRPDGTLLPLNALTSMIGIPIILIVLIRK